MVRKNVKMFVIGLVLAAMAGTMLVMTVARQGPADGLRPDQTVRDPSEIPPMQSPINNVDPPVQKIDDRRP